MNKGKLGIKRIAVLGVLTAVALTVFAIEARLPSLAPIPGVKLGLANIVTVWALVMLGPVDAAQLPADPAPFNHSTKIIVLDILRKDERI